MPTVDDKEQEGGEAPSKNEQFWKDYKAYKERPTKKHCQNKLNDMKVNKEVINALNLDGRFCKNG